MRLHKATVDKIFDLRLRDKFIADGNLNKNEVDSYLEAIPDEASLAKPLDIELPVTTVRPRTND
ncbi:MAG: hypothetical protein HQK50_06830 [Oligoflexia bacterium]|nr:hypothetical protein [Oligoflexia bacterium]MBF0365268.1 hypothetical protein [Oligoflexia bacterium]